MNALPLFPRKSFQLSHSKTFKKLMKKSPFQTLRTFVFELNVASKPFYRKLLLTNFDSNSSERFVSSSQKVFSILPLKILVKNKKCPFSIHYINTFVYELNVASKFSQWLNFDLIGFERFVTISEKTVSTASLFARN